MKGFYALKLFDFVTERYDKKKNTESHFIEANIKISIKETQKNPRSFV